MASDPKLVARLSSILAGRPEIEQRKMFGGVAYLLNGNMCVGVHKDWLIARAGELGPFRATLSNARGPCGWRSASPGP